MVLGRPRVIFFSMVFGTSSSLLSPSIRKIGAAPTRRADVAAAPRGADRDAAGATLTGVGTRRAAFGGALAIGCLLLGGAPEQAAAVGWDYDAAVEALPADRRITAKVRIAFRIAETQATTSTREGLPQENFEMVFGLYGKAAPQIVENFLRYCAPAETTVAGWGKPDLNLPARGGAGGSEDQGVAQPRLDKGQLWRLEPGVLLEGGKIRGLKEVSSGAALSYGTRLYPSGRLAETNLVTHAARGLLTRRLNAVGPAFEVTLAAAPQLDGVSTVFGEVLEGADFLYMLENIPVYTYSAAVGSGSMADSVFKAQKEAYTGMAKQLKDQRFEDLRGKLLRRVDIRQVTVL